jgi:hypothetical protein
LTTTTPTSRALTPVDGAEHDGLRLGARLRHARVGWRAEHRAREVGALAQPGPLQYPALERQVVVREHPRGGGLPHEGLARDGVRGARLVAREVQQVDGARAPREVSRGEDGAQAEARRRGRLLLLDRAGAGRSAVVGVVRWWERPCARAASSGARRT